MATLPQLLEEDIHRLDAILADLLARTDATTALIIDKGGFLITSHGDTRRFDITSIAALASGAFMANQTIAGLVHENNFNSIYQQGESSSMIAMCVDEYCLLVVIFRAEVGVGLVKYYAAPAVQRIATQMTVARQRNPATGLDLSELNLADTSDLFRRKS